MNLIHGDCIEKLKELSNNSVDSIVTDPPAGISFMGKEWDHDKGGRNEWIKWMSNIAKECLRVIKPGGHALVWAIPRTSHWTATAWEDGGFEVRDICMHIFGSGFPKSHNISKSIDGLLGVEREITGVRTDGRGKSPQKLNNHDKGDTGIGHMDGSHQTYVETVATSDESKQWDGWGTALKPACEHWILFRKPIEGTVAENVL
jgi:site-specific DNA-methyltransferase (adenine-specific)